MHHKVEVRLHWQR